MLYVLCMRIRCVCVVSHLVHECCVLHVLSMSVWCVLHVWQGVERWDGCYRRFFSYTTAALFHLVDAEPERAFD